MSERNDDNTGRQIQYSSDPVELVEQIAADLPDDEREAMLAEARSLQGLDPLTGHDLTPDAKPEGDDTPPKDAKPEGDDTPPKDAKPEGDDTPPKDAKPEGDDTPPKDAKPEGDDTPPKDAKPEDAKPGVKTADGEGVLDYSVLAQAREDTRRARAEAAAAEARAQAATATAKPEDKPDPVAEKLTEAIKTLRENEGDAVADAYEALAGVVTQKDAKIAELEGRLDRQAQGSAEEIAQSSQHAIDSNPTLAQWLADADAAARGVDGKSALAWQKAEALDDVLASSPEWQGRPLKDRFEEVVRILGDGAPGSGAPSDAPKGDVKPEDTKPKADTKPEDRKPSRTAPESISDLPSGDTPDSPLTKFENMSPQEIEAAIAARSGSMDEFDAIMRQVA